MLDVVKYDIPNSLAKKPIRCRNGIESRKCQEAPNA